MKKHNNSLMIKAVMLLLALIVVVFVASLAWFSENREATADGLSVSTNETQEFKMAVGFKNKDTKQYVVSNFTRHFNLRKVEVIEDEQSGVVAVYDVFKDMDPRDITGDGITLVRPTLKNKNSQIDHSGGYSVARPNEDYVSFDLYFQSANRSQIFLDDNSSVLGLIEKNGGELVDPNNPTKFSSDAIVGALRVAFTDYSVNDDSSTSDYELVNIRGELIKNEDVDDKGNLVVSRTAPNALWVPRSDIRFDDTDPANPVLHSGLEDSMSANASYVSDGWNMNTFKHSFFAYSNGNGAYKDSDQIITSTITGIKKDRTVICDVIHPGVDKYGNNCYYGKVHVNIWLEGCDSEARRVMNTGKFYIDFEILSRDIE